MPIYSIARSLIKTGCYPNNSRECHKFRKVSPFFLADNYKMEIEHIFIYIVLPIICISVIVAIIIKTVWKSLRQQNEPVIVNTRSEESNSTQFYDARSQFSNNINPQNEPENTRFEEPFDIILNMNMNKLRYMINDPELYNYIAHDIFMNKMAINHDIYKPELVTEETMNEIFESRVDVEGVEHTYNNMIYTYNKANMRFSTDIYSNFIKPSITINANIDKDILILELSVNSGMGYYVSITAKLRIIEYKNIIGLHLISVNISKLSILIKKFIKHYFGNISHNLDAFTERVNTGELNPQCIIILSLLADYINEIKDNYMINPYPILPNLDKFTDLDYIIDTIQNYADFSNYISDIDINDGKITANLINYSTIYRDINNAYISIENQNIVINIMVIKNKIVCNIDVCNGVLIIKTTLPFKKVDGGLQYDRYNKKIEVVRDKSNVFANYYNENTSGINQSAPDITKIIRNRFLHGDYDMFIDAFLYESNSRSDSNF